MAVVALALAVVALVLYPRWPEVAVVEEVTLALAVQVEDALEAPVVALGVQVQDPKEVVEDKVEVALVVLQQ